MVMTTICFIFGMFFPRAAAGIFTHDEELLALSARALRITTIAFPIVGFQMIATNFFQSLGMVRKSIILSLSRQILFLLPLLYILPNWIGSDGVWASFPIADSIATVMTIIMLGKLFKKFTMLKDGDDPSILGSNL
jgi:Na+-driven multidrug efflux pump